jgi:hypothetical protein
LCNIAKEAGIGMDFYAANETIKELADQQAMQKAEVKSTFYEFDNWDDFLIFSREVKKDDLLVIISSRKGHVSFQPALDKLPYYLSNYFATNSFIMLFPQQVERGIKMNDVQFVDSSLAETITNKVARVGKAKNIWMRWLSGKK